jgi:DNA-binding NarL/FixJ family response regulator
MTVETSAVLVAKADGTVLSQNGPARRLMGSKAGYPCWEVVGGLEEAEGLPCQPGCVAALLARGLELSKSTAPCLEGRRHHLTCVPLTDTVVCVLRAQGPSEPESWELLTPREQEVLRLLASGETTASVASLLDLSESTVRTHVENMRSKLAVSTRAGLVAAGFRFGYLD